MVVVPRDAEWERGEGIATSMEHLRWLLATQAVAAVGAIAAAIVLINLTARALAQNRDSSARKGPEQEALRRLSEASRLKSEFLANMSHELRTPLNTIIGFASLIQSGKAGQITVEQREFLGHILASSRHLLQLISDLLDVAKIEAGKMELRVERVALAPLVDEVRDAMSLMAAEKHIEIDYDVDPALISVTLDAARLRQVLFNYLSNAIKFTPEGGSVALRIFPEGEMFRIEVEDTGIGISAEELPHLFAEFEQLDSGAAEKYPGTGLGLSLTKRIVEAQGGSVAVKSTPGVGSMFSAVLPKVVSDSPGRPHLAHPERSRTIRSQAA